MPSTFKIDELVKQFHRDGFIVIPEVLDRYQCEVLKNDLDRIANEQGSGKSRGIYIYKRLFEKSEANLELFIQEPIISFAEAVFQDDLCKPDDSNFVSTSLQCHVIHNNGMIVPAGGKGVEMWHQDDPPHYIVTEGEAPKNVHLPCLVFTCNYYLTDVNRVENGPTHAIAGSHLWGKPCPNVIDESKYKITACTAPAGSAVIFNCQVWHRGGHNTSTQPRYVSQVSYGRRIVGHKYYPFMNYQMPQEVADLVKEDKRWKRVAGFLDHGAYG